MHHLARAEGGQAAHGLQVLGQLSHQGGVELHQGEGRQGQAQRLRQMGANPLTPQARAVGLLALDVIALVVGANAQQGPR